MNRVAGPYLVFALAMASTASAAGKLAIPPTGAYLGLWASPALAPSPEKTIEVREGLPPLGIGRTFAMHLVYYHWTDIAAQLSAGGVFQPDFTLLGDISHGRVPVISWKCDDTIPNSNHVIAGGDVNEDAVITASAKALAQYPGPVMLRWFWEFNQLNKNQGCRGDTGGAPTPQVYADFIGAWQHIWTLFQKAGATNVVFLWNPGSYTAGAQEDPHGYYPGNAYVDWIGIDTYQRNTADTFVSDFGQFYSDFSQNQYGGKPLMVGENGSFNYSLNNLEVQAAYIQGVLGAMQANRYPLLKAYDYFDAGGIDSKGNLANWALDDNNGQGIGGLVAFAALGASPLFSPPSSTLLPSPDGTTVYDAANNVNWLADFNLAASDKFGLPVCNGSTNTKACVNASGSMSYQAAAAWVAGMNAANYLGHSNWQLPTTPIRDNACGFIGPQNNSFGFNCAAGAMGSLYYTALGLAAPNTAVPIPNNTAGPFSNFQPYLYWSQTSTQTDIGFGTFSFNTGIQGSNTKPNFLYALPMIQGKISGTPPASGSGLEVNPGGQTVYDPVANVTWLANANLAATNTFGLPLCTAPGKPQTCVNQDGAMNWDSATQFVTNMNTGTGYLGQKNWQLPPVDPNCATFYNCVNSPLGELFYGQLGLSAGTPVVATPDTAVGPFRHIQPYLYWSCEAATVQDACQTTGPASGFEWSFSFGNGFLGTDILQNEFYVTAYFVNSCTYSLSAGGQAFAASGGTGSITIATQAGCPWVVGALPAGVSLTSPGSGFGSTTVTFQIVPNAGGDVSGSFIIAGQTFIVEQATAAIAGLAASGSLGQVASEGGWDFSLIGINLGTSAATARFSFADNNGNPLMLPLTFPQSPPAAGPELAATLDRTLAPNAQIVMESTGPDSLAPLAGSGQLLSNGSVSGFGIFSNPKVHWNAVVPLETRNASKYILAFDNTGALTTGLAIANLTAVQQNIQVIVRNDKGTQIGSAASISLSALGHTSFMLDPPPPGFPVTKGLRGTIEFDTPPGGQISVLGLRVNGAALTTLPVLANVGTTGGSITHVAYNGGWTSVFYIVNTGNASAQFTLSFADENGGALAVPLLLPQSGTNPTTSALTRTLAAGEMLVVNTNQQDSPIAQSGSAQLTTTGNIGGFEIFRWNTFGQEASVPLEMRSPNSFVLVFDDTNGLTTGVALASNFGLQANVTATFRDDTGAQIGVPQSIILSPHGHKSFLLPDLLAAAAGKRGMVEFAAPQGQNFSVIGLRARSSDGTLTTIPVLAK